MLRLPRAWAAGDAPSGEIKLWPNGAPDEPPRSQFTVSESDNTPERIKWVGEPSLTVFRPPDAAACGTAVMICPGGGYHHLAWQKEGVEIAQWLNGLGVTALVLKYRVPRRDPDQPHLAPLQDAQRAMRIARKHARAWGYAPDRLGILGFSAGGHLAIMTALHGDDSAYPRVDDADELSCRPDFLVPIYPAYLGDETTPGPLHTNICVTSRTPPTFIAVTDDDKLRGLNAAQFYIALKKAGVSAELHIYSKGGHGYGIRPSPNPVSTWHHRCEDWLRVSGWLTPRSSARPE